jgi:hypothetical protein
MSWASSIFGAWGWCGSVNTSGDDSGKVNFPQAKRRNLADVRSNGRPKSDTIPNVQKRERHDLVSTSWGR